MISTADIKKNTKTYPKKIIYPLLISALLVCLVATLPAQIMSKLLPNTLKSIPMVWGGTVWNGQLLIKQDSWSHINWHLQPWTLVKGRINLNLNSQGNVSLMGNINLGLHDWFIDIDNGLLPSDIINAFLPSGSHFNGPLSLKKIQLHRLKKTGEWQSASGELYWDGGNFEFLMNGALKKVSLPPLTITLSQLQKNVLISLQERDSRAILATINIDEHNVGETKIRERLLRYSNDYHSQNNQLDDIIVVSKQAF